MKEELGRAIAALKKSLPGARWVPVRNIHVTLAFLGRVEEERVAALSAATAGAVQDHVDFTVRLGALGAFPLARRARVIWAGLDDPTRGLAGLADSVADALEPLGFPREARDFQPHATIARLKPPVPVDLTVTLAPLTFAVERISLFESHIQRSAPVYEEVATFPFRRGS